MSNIEPKCSYPECGPTCRKDCPPLPAKPIEPTEEQKQAARDFLRKNFLPTHSDVDELADFLAEREAKLSKEHEDFFFKNQNDWIDTIDTLRARVAELGQAAGEVNDALGVLDLCMVVPLVRELEAREAQHLADIKALKDDAFHRHVACVGGCSVCDLNSGARCALMQRLAHYDDAKADAPAFESEHFHVGGGAAADDGAVCKVHDAEGGEG